MNLEEIKARREARKQREQKTPPEQASRSGTSESFDLITSPQPEPKEAVLVADGVQVDIKSIANMLSHGGLVDEETIKQALETGWQHMTDLLYDDPKAYAALLGAFIKLAKLEQDERKLRLPKIEKVSVSTNAGRTETTSISARLAEQYR